MQKNEWSKAHLFDQQAKPPFSFVYGEQPSDELLADWPRKVETKQLDAARTQHTTRWTDPKTGLEVRCVAVDYNDYPVTEWTVYFKNGGTNSTPILKDIQGLDTWFERGEGGEFVLHGNKGDWNVAEGYEPYQHTLGPGTGLRFAPTGGRPTNGPNGWPYYNLQMPGGGLILAIGWPGQWAASFAREDERGLRIAAGQELTFLSLKPGEEIRTPLMAMMFWQGADVIRAQNVWRRWMIAHNLPRPAGKPLSPMLIMCSGGFFPGLKVSEASEREFIETFVRERIPLTHWWMDAGWYACDHWGQTGTWEVDAQRFPNGIKAVSDLVHANKMELILWFEPERVTKGSWLHKTHPEWLLGGSLLDLGNPAARAWVTDHVDRMIREQGIDLYRQDFNMDPLNNWRHGESADRQGMRENLYVQGYLAYWDELRRRHPGMLIDSCASGGRRNDLETMRRALPLLRSDYQSFTADPGYANGNQGHTYGLSSWIPFFGQGVYLNPGDQSYYVRSHMSPSFGICWDVRKPDLDWNFYRKMVAQFRRTADLMLADYYPLTSWSLDDSNWIAWQYNRPETGEGMIQAFRRDKCEDATRTFRLNGLDPTAQYEVTNFDVAGSTKVSGGSTPLTTGKDLMEKGLSMAIQDKPGSAVIAYNRIQ